MKSHGFWGLSGTNKSAVRINLTVPFGLVLWTAISVSGEKVTSLGTGQLILRRTDKKNQYLFIATVYRGKGS